LPFDDGQFDVVLSTYSMCPLYDPAKGALELYRVTKPGGKIGVAHSTEPQNPAVKWLADRVENWAWHFPSISMGCRSVEVLPTLKSAGGKVLFSRNIGVPLWPFLVFIVEKPVA
jgi:ubiquinone/menaquinone biosynthesis C-methylase UbiE